MELKYYLQQRRLRQMKEMLRMRVFSYYIQLYAHIGVVTHHTCY
jgi:hypothetical protein